MTGQTRFTFTPGDTVTAWELGPPEQTYFPGDVTPGNGEFDYTFINGFVDVGDLPCRVAVRDDVATRETPCLEPFDAVELRLPGFDRKLDFSGFWHVPHRLRRWARTRLVPPTVEPSRFAIATCGGVHIWVDGQLAAVHEPYTRNTPQTRCIDLPLAAQGSDVVVLLEDMAERDTDFFLEMTWDGPGPLRAELPGRVDPGAMEALQHLARSLRPDRIAFDGNGPLTLRLDAPAPVDVQISAAVGQSVHLSHKPPLWQARATLPAGDVTLALGDLASLPDGYHPLSLRLEAGGARMECSQSFALLRQPLARALQGDLPARKRQALDYSATHGEDRIGRVLALLATGQTLDAAAREALEDTLEGIEARRDCSDFVMVPLIWALARYPAALPDDLAARARQAILGYRYWVDEPGNDTMWFWSENHVLCFHVSQYLAGGLFPDEVFANSGLTGQQHRARATRRLGRWFDSVEAHGLAEWNSAAYYPIDFIGLLALEHLGEGEIRARARAALDRLFEMIALHTIGGVAAGSMGRAYDKELRAGPLNELAPVAAVAFGRGWLNGGVAALPLFCLSDYTPPAGLAAHVDPAPETAITARYVQGYGAAARLQVHKTNAMLMSAAVDGPAGQRGHQQHLLDVQFAARPFARVWVNHPGDDDPWGGKRPSYWAGNGVMPRVGMSGDRALMLSCLPLSAGQPFTHAYAPLSEFDAIRRGEDWLVLWAGQGALILKATGPIQTQAEGPGAGLEHRVDGHVTGWALLAARPGTDMASLCARASALELRLDGAPRDKLVLRDPDRPVLTLEYRAGLAIDGRPAPFQSTEIRPDITVTQTARVRAEKAL